MTKTPYILVVEDDIWLAEHHVRTIAQAGFYAEHVGHAPAAMDAIDMRIPECIVLDVFLTGQVALVLLHELQSHPDLAMIPIVLCTGSARDILPEDAAAYGVRQILDKATMRPEDLVAAIKKVLP
jgi:CheY-like chemotaxis protein